MKTFTNTNHKNQRENCLVNPLHITASIFINEEESLGLRKISRNGLRNLHPKFDYKHHQTGEDNGFSHLRRTIRGRESVVAITKG